MSIIFDNPETTPLSRSAAFKLRPRTPKPPAPATAPPTNSTAPDAHFSRRKAARLPPLTGPPTNRQELMQFLALPTPVPLPPHHLLTLRSHVVSLGFLDDAGPVALLAGFAAYAREPKFCVRFLQQALKVMVRAGKSHTNIAQAFEGPVVKLAKREDWDAVLVLTSAIARRAGIRTQRLVAARVRALYAKGRVSEVPQEVERLVELSGDLYDDLIGAHLAMGNIADAQEALAQKQQAGHPTTVRTALALLEGNWSLNGNLTMEEKLLDQSTKAQLVTAEGSREQLRQHALVLNKILAARTQRGDCTRALEVMGHFDLSGAPPLAVPTRNAPPASAKAARGQGSVPEPVDGRHWRPRPDARTFVILSSLALKQGRADCAVVLVAQAIEAGVDVTPKLVAALIRALAAYGRVSRAEELFFSLPRGDTRVTVSRLGVKVMVPKMIPSSVALEAILGGVLKAQGLEGGRLFLERVTRQQGQPPKLTTGLVNVLVNHLTSAKSSQNHSPSTIASLLYKVKKLDSSSSPSLKRPTVRNLNALLAAQFHRARFAKPTRSSRYRRRIQARAASAERDALSNVELPKARPSSVALARLRQSLADSDMPTHLPNTSSLMLKVQQFNLSPQDMWNHVQTELVENDLHPTRHHLALILAADIREGDPQGALDSLRRGLEMGIEQHVALYSVLIGGLARLGKFSLARQVYVEMKLAAVLPDRRLYAALALAAARRRDIAGFNAVLEEAEKELPLSDKLRNGSLRLDPVFVAIQYRTLVASRRVLDALQLVALRLQQGLVPDKALQLSVRRTNRWLRWKNNQINRGSGSRGARIATLAAAVGTRDLDKVMRRAVGLDVRLRRMVRRREEQDRKGELDRIVGLWGERREELVLAEEVASAGGGRATRRRVVPAQARPSSAEATVVE